MSSQKFDRQDMIGGAATFMIGLGATVISLGYRMGSLSSIGPGFFPALLGALLMLIGLGILAGAFRRGEDENTGSAVNPRAVLGVGGALVAFALLMRWFGVVPAIIGCVLISRLSEADYGLGQTILLALGLAVASWLIFVVGLNLPLPVLRMP